MKVLIVSQYFWPESFIINGLAEDLVRRGHQVEVLTALPNYPKGQLSKGYSFFSGPWAERWNQILIHRAPIFSRGSGHVRLALNYISFVIFASLRILFMKKDFDIVFCYAPSPVTSCLPAILCKKIIKKPLIFWVQDLWPESIAAVGAVRSQKIIAILESMVALIYRNCDRILMQSKAFEDSINKYNPKNVPLSYVPNWADPFPDTETPDWVKSLPPQKFIIGFAGNIGKAQDMKTIVRAAELLKDNPDILWVIAGDGSDKIWLDHEIENKSLQKSILTVGRKPYSEMLPFFKSCSALLVSLTDEYIFSLTIPAKIQAYMSAEKPIIASVAGAGANIVLDAKAGVACRPETPEALVEAVLKIKNMALPERNQLAKSGKQYFDKNFERSIVVDQIEQIFINLTESKKI